MATLQNDRPCQRSSGNHLMWCLQGDMLAVSPYESHHDERFFQPNPTGYDPLRGGLQCPGTGLHEVPGVGGIAGLVFGGGRYRCQCYCPVVLTCPTLQQNCKVASTFVKQLVTQRLWPQPPTSFLPCFHCVVACSTPVLTPFEGLSFHVSH